MKTPRQFLASLFTLGAAVLLATGCQSAPKTPLPAQAEDLSFPRALDVSASTKVANENDPRQLIPFALNLAERGRHAEAAQFFGDAATKFASRDNELTVACRAAQATELFLANDTAGFRRAIVQLKSDLNRYQIAAADGPLAAILALGEIALGEEKPSSLTPPTLRDLYATPKATAGTDHKAARD